jgi:hypothetical protein
MLKGADGAKIGMRSMVSREQEMVSIVDHHSKLRIVIGAAASASLRGAFMDLHAHAARRQPHSG